MAQESFDSLNRRTANQLTQDKPVDSGGADTTSIKRDIERTRMEMSGTIGEIQDRLRPDHLLQQARDGVKEAAAGKARSIMNSAGETAASVAYRAKGVGDQLAAYVQEHPIRIAVTVGALAWFMLRGRDRSDEWYGVADTSSWADDGGPAYEEGMTYDESRSLRGRVGEFASTARDTVGEYASSAREKTGEYASSARETVGEYASIARETVGEYAESARIRANRASEAARRAASTATTSVDDWVHENPLAAGGIALAVGALIGMSVPASAIENRTMGEVRDRAWQRASKAASEIKDNVTRKVESVAEDFAVDTLMGADAGSTTEPIGRA